MPTSQESDDADIAVEDISAEAIRLASRINQLLRRSTDANDTPREASQGE
jgi:hypothetical protein